MTERDDENDVYGLAPEAQTKPLPGTARPQRMPPAAPSSAPSIAPRIAPPGNPRGKPGNGNTLDTEDLENFYIPIWLLVGGVVVEFFWALLLSPHFLSGLIYVGAKIVLGTAIMLAGVFIAASYRQIDLGKFPVAVLKLAAVSIAPAAAFDLLMVPLRYVPLGILIGAVGEFILYFALLGMFFDLDESDTWYCVWIIFLVHVGVYFALLSLRA